MLVGSPQGIELMAKAVGASDVKSLDELIAVSDAWMEHQVKQGAIEFKTGAVPCEHADRETAAEIAARALKGESVSTAEAQIVGVFIRDENARKAAELGVPLAIHTGVWNDFRTNDVKHLIGLIARHPDTRMDLYHLGIPSVRDAIQVVKNYANAYLNLCWAHIVAPDMLVTTMREAMDMVPVNKVFAFGADYILFVEKVYGHLHMAKENIALVLGDRVERCLMDLDEAKVVLKQWFYDNPREFYGFS